MSRKNVILVALGILSTFAFGPSPAQAQNDFYALYNRYRFHQVGYSARSAAMGGAYSAMQDAENSLLGNPAALGFQERPFITGGFDWEDVASDIQFDGAVDPVEGESELWNVNFGGLYPFEWGAVSLQYGYRWDDLESGLTNLPYFGNRLKLDGDSNRHFGGLGVGYQVMDNLSLGYRFGYFDYELDRTWIWGLPGAPMTWDSFNDDFQGHRHQLGAQYVVNEQLTLGVDGSFAFGDCDTTSQLFGKFNEDADSYAVRGGVAWKALADIPLLLALDVSFDRYEKDGVGKNDEDLVGIHFGAEYEVYENLFLRAGYQYENYDYQDQTGLSAYPMIDESFDVGGYSAGIGYKYNQVNFDYGFMYLDTGSGDTAHYFSIGYEF